MKKILPIVAFLGATSLLTGCNALTNVNNNDLTIKDNIRSFQECFTDFSKINNQEFSKTINRYKLSITAPEGATLVNSKNESENNDKVKAFEENLDTTKLNKEENANQSEENKIIEEETELIENETTNEINEENTTNDTNYEENDNQINTNNEQQEFPQEISTLYYLSEDIEDSCDEFCDLKEDIVEAITETENLITKLQENKINLTREQRLFINEQSNQLKSLSRQLANATTELSFNLSDLNEIIKSNNQDYDKLSLKYLMVLDNLVNGNEMLQNGLSSLNMINNLFNMPTSNVAPNNTGRILYGFQRNGEKPIIKDYYVDENGELVENQLKESENETNLTNNEANLPTNNENVDNKQTQNEKKVNIDTYKNTSLTSNIDTYGNNRQNIDTFFNTALLDNEFMYGNNGYAGNGMYGYGNPYMNQYYNYEQNNKENSLDNNENPNTNDSVNNTNNTQDNVNDQKKKKDKKFKLKANIDTYRDKNTPSVKTKLNNFKQSVSGFFKNLGVKPKDDIRNPIYQYNLDE